MTNSADMAVCMERANGVKDEICDSDGDVRGREVYRT